MAIALIITSVINIIYAIHLFRHHRCKHDWSAWSKRVSVILYTEGGNTYRAFTSIRRCFKCGKDQVDEVAQHRCTRFRADTCTHWDTFRPLFSKDDSIRKMEQDMNML